MQSLTRLIIGCAAALLVGCHDTQYVHVGPNWDGLQRLQPGEQSFPVEVRGPDHERIGEKIRFAVRSPQAGTLWVVQVDPADEVSLIYPNTAATQTPIAADTWLEVPPAGAGWSLEADKPVGASLFAFVVTTGDTDIRYILTQAEGKQATMAKAIRVVSEGGAWGLAKHVLTVQP